MVSALRTKALASPETQCQVPVVLLRFFDCECVLPTVVGSSRPPGWYFNGMLLGDYSTEAARTLSKMLLSMWEGGLLSHYYRRFCQSNEVNMRLMVTWKTE